MPPKLIYRRFGLKQKESIAVALQLQLHLEYEDGSTERVTITVGGDPFVMPQNGTVTRVELPDGTDVSALFGVR